jgi:hypothetical protein
MLGEFRLVVSHHGRAQPQRRLSLRPERRALCAELVQRPDQADLSCRDDDLADSGRRAAFHFGVEEESIGAELREHLPHASGGMVHEDLLSDSHRHFKACQKSPPTEPLLSAMR